VFLLFDVLKDVSFIDYLCQGGGYAIRLVCLAFVLSVCRQDYCKSNHSISLKLGKKKYQVRGFV